MAWAWAFGGTLLGGWDQSRPRASTGVFVLRLITDKPTRLQVWGRTKTRLPQRPLRAGSAGTTEKRVFPGAAMVDRENSVQNFPWFCVSLLIYFNSLLLLFAWGNQQLPAPAPWISQGFNCVPFTGLNKPPTSVRPLLSLLTSPTPERPPVPMVNLALWTQKRHLKAFLTSRKDCLVRTEEPQGDSSPPEQRGWLTGCHGPELGLPQPRLKLHSWLARTEQSIGKGDCILVPWL